jgi:hypothetical protein
MKDGPIDQLTMQTIVFAAPSRFGADLPKKINSRGPSAPSFV